VTGGNFKSFSYDLDSGTSYETLNMYFSSDNKVKEGDATYIATLKGGQIGFFGHVYAPIDSDNFNLLSQVLVNESEKSIRVREPYLLRNGYILTCGDITGENILVELTRNGVLVDSNIFSEGELVVFKTAYGNDEITFFECEIETLIGETIILRNIRQYSKTPLKLALGERYGDFKISEITDSKIVLENTEPITIRDEDSILDNWIKFDVSGTTATPYTEIILQ
jgi:S-layer protein